MAVLTQRPSLPHLDVSLASSWDPDDLQPPSPHTPPFRFSRWPTTYSGMELDSVEINPAFLQVVPKDHNGSAWASFMQSVVSPRKTAEALASAVAHELSPKNLKRKLGEFCEDASERLTEGVNRTFQGPMAHEVFSTVTSQIANVKPPSFQVDHVVDTVTERVQTMLPKRSCSAPPTPLSQWESGSQMDFVWLTATRACHALVTNKICTANQLHTCRGNMDWQDNLKARLSKVYTNYQQGYTWEDLSNAETIWEASREDDSWRLLLNVDDDLLDTRFLLQSQKDWVSVKDFSRDVTSEIEEDDWEVIDDWAMVEG